MGTPRTLEVVFEDAMGKESRRYTLRMYRGRNSGCVVELEGGTGGWLDADRCRVLMQPW